MRMYNTITNRVHVYEITRKCTWIWRQDEIRRDKNEQSTKELTKMPQHGVFVIRVTAKLIDIRMKEVY